MSKRLEAKGKAAPPPEPDFVATTDSVKVQAAKIAAQQARFTAAFKPKAGTLYVRNLREIDCRFTLDGGRRIELKARGQVDDIAPVSKEEQADSKFIINAGLLFEILTPAQASQVIKKQAINAQNQRRNPLLDHLLNEKGEAYEIEDVHIDPTLEQRSITVAKIVEAPDGKNTTDNKDFLREATGPQEVAVPGSRQAPLPHIPSDISAEDVREFIAWKEAQQLRDSLGTPVMEDTQTVDTPDE
jgi:hypothetical protein